ncbi:DUF2267 domain-containing protein [Chelativorans xinjiangense]|uniref:DUF2267 domain-containing protein n=1 Tax=Chelativorans xinjiangense TaxID=2681485 RepID=UPI00135B1C71|nr:DUF2267 domain-containing protein [Chelativorans xinjiangense]
MTVTQEVRKAVEDTTSWIDDLMQRLGWHESDHAYLALVAGLHALRDALGRDEAISLGAQLPPLLRGLYYEGWHPGQHAAARGRGAFLERIHDGVHRSPAIDAERVARALLALLAARLSAPELENAKAATPPALHYLWPD